MSWPPGRRPCIAGALLTVLVCLQTPAGDAGTLLPSGRLLRGQERGAPRGLRERRQPAPCLLAAFHPPIHVPRDEGEVSRPLARPGLVSGDSGS